MSQISVDKKKVLMNGTIPGKRMVSLRTYKIEHMEKRRGILFSLFKNEEEYHEKVEQVVNIFLDITVWSLKQKKPVDYMSVYQKSYEDWIGDLTFIMVPCQTCKRPPWSLASTIIATIPLERVYYHDMCQFTDNLLSYCSMSPDHRNIYYAVLQIKETSLFH